MAETKTKTCFVVLRNADFTEGRGPMVLDSVFAKLRPAQDYIMAQGGIFGSTQRLDTSLSKPGQWHYNGYEIKEMLLLTETYRVDLEEMERLKALSKLSDRERTLLGL